jgi:hypothetical protein
MFVNEVNSNNLLESFPRLYRKGGMFRGFECGDGWHRIIYGLSAAVEVIAGHRGVGPDSDQWPLVQQVKEKFGGLRFYLWNANDEMGKLVEEAERRSLKTCEECGQAGRVRNRSWVRTLCDRSERERATPDQVRS